MGFRVRSVVSNQGQMKLYELVAPWALLGVGLSFARWGLALPSIHHQLRPSISRTTIMKRIGQH